MAKYCVKCGAKNPNDAAACSCCGMSLGGESVKNPVTIKPKEDKKKDVVPDISISVKTDVQKKENISKTTKETVTLDLEKINQFSLLVNKGLVREIQCQNDFIYILDEKTDFSSTEYKVINSIGNKGILKCKKIKYDGKDALYYMAEQLKSFYVMLPALDSTRFLYILENLLSQVNSIKSNGFLADTGIDLRIKKIFIDSTDGKVYLTYVPINQRCYSDVMYLEQDLRMDLAYVINTIPNIQNAATLNIAQMMEEPACSFGNLLSAIRQNRSMAAGTNR